MNRKQEPRQIMADRRNWLHDPPLELRRIKPNLSPNFGVGSHAIPSPCVQAGMALELGDGTVRFPHRFRCICGCDPRGRTLGMNRSPGHLSRGFISLLCDPVARPLFHFYCVHRRLNTSIAGARIHFYFFRTSFYAAEYTTMAQSPVIGGPGGAPFAFSCPAGSHIIQVNARSGSWLDGASFTCSDGTKSPYYGGQGGAAWSEPSAGGFTGLGNSSGGVYVDRLQFQRADGTLSPARGGGATAGTKTIVWGGCPSGQVISSVSGGSGAYLDRLQVGCSEIAKAVTTAVSTAVSAVAPTPVAPITPGAIPIVSAGTPVVSTATQVPVVMTAPDVVIGGDHQQLAPPPATNWGMILLFIVFVFAAIFLTSKMMSGRSVAGGFDDDFY